MKSSQPSYILFFYKKGEGLLELPTCKDDPVDLMPQVKGRTHVVGLEDMPAKIKLNIITNKRSFAGTISLFMI